MINIKKLLKNVDKTCSTKKPFPSWQILRLLEGLKE